MPFCVDTSGWNGGSKISFFPFFLFLFFLFFLFLFFFSLFSPEMAQIPYCFPGRRGSLIFRLGECTRVARMSRVEFW